MSFFVCFLYASKAAAKMASKFAEEVATDGNGDIGLVERDDEREVDKARTIGAPSHQGA